MPVNTTDQVLRLKDKIAELDRQITELTSQSFTSYTPNITGDGASAWSSSGRWLRIGGLIWMNAVIRWSTTGTGTNNLTVTAPTNIDRTERQAISGDAEGLSPTHPACHALSFTVAEGGSIGPVFDRIKVDVVGNLTATQITAALVITLTGFYREG